MTNGRPRAGAFSLIELLVVIAIIGLLVAIILPVLGKTRVAAKETQALANGRTVAISFGQYEADYRTYPYADSDHDPEGLPFEPPPGVIVFRWFPEGVILATSSPWELDRFWPAPLSASAPWTENYPVWVSPGMRTSLVADPAEFEHSEEGEMINASSWAYANSFIAAPALWSGSSVADEKLLKGIGGHEVAFPSAKVLLWDSHLAYLPRQPEQREGHWDAPTPMAFADLHAAVHNPMQASEPVANPLTGAAIRLHDTRDGVQGRDY